MVPFKQVVNDRYIFWLALKGRLLSGEKVIGDMGYKGVPQVHTELDAVDWAHKRAMSKLRARHETLNGRMKLFKCLGERYRHSLEKHHLVFEAVMTLTQVGIYCGFVPFQVNSYENIAFVSHQ